MLPIGLTLGPLTFLAPLALLGLILLPLIWWLLRVTPPSPKKQTFPPLRILQNVMTEEETPDSTPIWLLLFRLLMAALIAIALARPILFQPEGVASRPAALIIDDGWDGAANWNAMMREAESRISDARRKNVNVLLATSNEGPFEFVPAQDAMRQIKRLQPSALPTDHKALSEKLAEVDLSGSDVIWLSGGIDHGGAANLASSLTGASSLLRLSPASEISPLIPGAATESADGFRSIWHRPDTRSLRSAEIMALGSNGSVIARSNIDFSPGAKTAEANFEIPSELRSRITVLRASGFTSAGSVKLLDDSWGRPLIGVLTPKTDNSSPLLSEAFYAQTALGPYADIYTGSLDELLPLAPSIIVMPDAARAETEDLREFVENGGLLIRFAGPRLAKRPDGLLPVLLRAGGRELGGALTWEDPQRLAPFPESSPFFGLKIPDDIKVKQQVMAEPSAQTDSRTWARLEDGSPVVTSSQQGFGRIVLFHVTAGPEWSNLPVGGLYVEMLRRLLGMARATPSAAKVGTGDWAPERILNGFGRLDSPSIDVRPIADEAFDNVQISRENPPGLYRQGARRKALNTVSDPKSITAMANFPGFQTEGYGQTKERTLGGLLLAAALVMLILDAIFALIVSGRLGYLKPKAIASVAVFSMMVSTGLPQESYAQEAIADDALDLHFAYVETGDARRDRMSEAAMEGLVRSLNRRTTIEPVGVRGVDPETDPLVFYPFLYYPVDRQAPTPSPKAAQALNAFMAGGGTIIFDTQDAGDNFLSGTAHSGLIRITENLDMPTLAALPEDHVLTKSFYLLKVFPGRWANGTVWVDKNANGAARDGVSSVIVGSNDWAAGWATDENGDPLQTLERDIPNQREMSLRFGVNVAMYALSGNYKSDQVHAAALVERIGNLEDRQPENQGRDEEETP